MAKKITTIIFDYDGVLVNSRPAWDAVLPFISSKKFSPKELDVLWGGRQKDVLKMLNITRLKVIISAFKIIRGALPLLRSVPLRQNVSHIIPQLAQHYTLAINSNTPSFVIREVLKKHNLEQYFVEIFGGGLTGNKQKKLKKMLHKLTINVDEVVFITDTAVDILDAHAVDIKSIAMKSDFDTLKKLESAQPVAIINTFEELKNLQTILNLD